MQVPQKRYSIVKDAATTHDRRLTFFFQGIPNYLSSNPSLLHVSNTPEYFILICAYMENQSTMFLMTKRPIAKYTFGVCLIQENTYILLYKGKMGKISLDLYILN